jgi:hypothetical protein
MAVVQRLQRGGLPVLVQTKVQLGVHDLVPLGSVVWWCDHPMSERQAPETNEAVTAATALLCDEPSYEDGGSEEMTAPDTRGASAMGRMFVVIGAPPSLRRRLWRVGTIRISTGDVKHLTPHRAFIARRTRSVIP